MANALLQMAMTTNVLTIVRRAKAVLRLPSISSATSFLATTDDDSAQELAACVNDALMEFHSDFPIMNVVRTTMTTTAGDARTALPEDLRNADILAMEWAYGCRHGDAITLLNAEDVLALPDWYRSGAQFVDPPDYVTIEWGQDGNNGNFRWYPVPCANREFVVTYRENAETVTVDHVKGVEPYTVPVPDNMVECFVYCLAAKIGERDTGANSVEPAVVYAKYKNMVDQWTDRLASTPYQTMTARNGFAGMPSRAGGSRFSDVIGPRIFRRR